MFKTCIAEIDSYFDRDPAARNRLEIFLCYPGLHAILIYRAAHCLWKKEWKLLARLLSHFARFITGIEIHPGAVIGKRCFIDHGMGVVIGETSEIGDDVTLYHGVTLGGISLQKGNRHPTIGNGVVVGAGAQLLGPVHIGDNACIGSNAVVIEDVPAGETMVGVPARAVTHLKQSEAAKQDHPFNAYGEPVEGIEDPVQQMFKEMQDEMSALKEQLSALQSASPKGGVS